MDLRSSWLRSCEEAALDAQSGSMKLPTSLARSAVGNPLRCLRLSGSMSAQSPNTEELQAAIAFLHSRGRHVEAVPGDRVGLHKVDGRLSTERDVLRHAVAAGLFSDTAPRRRG